LVGRYSLETSLSMPALAPSDPVQLAGGGNIALGPTWGLINIRP